MHKEIKTLVKALENRGLLVERRGNHFKVRDQEGKLFIALPSTPGRGRWRQNLIAELRRKGLLD